MKLISALEVTLEIVCASYVLLENTFFLRSCSWQPWLLLQNYSKPMERMRFRWAREHTTRRYIRIHQYHYLMIALLPILNVWKIYFYSKCIQNLARIVWSIIFFMNILMSLVILSSYSWISSCVISSVKTNKSHTKTCLARLEQLFSQKIFWNLLRHSVYGAVSHCIYYLV